MSFRFLHCRHISEDTMTKNRRQTDSGGGGGRGRAMSRMHQNLTQN